MGPVPRKHLNHRVLGAAMASDVLTQESLAQLYRTMLSRVGAMRQRLKRPLTLAEKILAGHLDGEEWERGKATLRLRPDRVCMQDVTGQMALLQFMQARKERVCVPATVHCDHLIVAQSGAAEDLKAALKQNEEVYAFLSSAASKYGVGFWKPGSGIIHQVVLEQYAFPGGLLIGSDSHTPNAGGLGMLSCGVGGADCAEVMAGLPWTVLHPQLVGVKLTGTLSGWASAKDVIVWLCGKLSVKGGTNRIIEYFGPGARSISATGKATICNMGAELGATASIFPYDERMGAYLRATGRKKIADMADQHRSLLTADPEVESHPEKHYDEVVELDLSTLQPQVSGPHSPDRVRPLSALAEEARGNNWPAHISSAMIGSCTNSSYEDMSRAAAVARQASFSDLNVRVPLLITPGSAQIYETMKRDGLVELFESVGAVVMANACGPCIGQWKRSDVKAGEVNTILSSYNRNFPGRNDGSQSTLSFLTSPEVVTAMAFSGELTFNPLQDSIGRFHFSPPSGDELPAKGFARGQGYQAPASDPKSVLVVIPENSERLCALKPFPAWDGKDFEKLPILVKTKGQTTTDHISPAGPWLRLRGNLEKLSDNIFLGANNAFTGEAGKARNVLTGELGTPSAVARAYKEKGIGCIVIGDENYGEGSSREHAAMSPRYLGVKAVITRSFARIHESNLKKQGILPLTFKQAKDYEEFCEGDRVSILGLAELAPGKPVRALLHKTSGDVALTLKHSLNEEQVRWFKAGSALNSVK